MNNNRTTLLMMNLTTMTTSRMVQQANTFEDSLKRAGKAIYFYSSAIFDLTGILLCTACFLFFLLNRALNKTIMGYIYAIQSAIYALVLLMNYLFYGFVAEFRDLTRQSIELCNVVNYLSRVLMQMAAFFQVYIIVDRYVSIRWSNRFAFKSKKWFVNIVLLAQCVTLGVLNVAYTFYFRRPPDNHKSYTCTFRYRNEHVSTFAELMSSIMASWLPCALMTLFNVLTLRLLIESKRRVNKQQSAKNRMESNKGVERLTMTVVKLSALFVLSNVPKSITWLVKDIYQKSMEAASSNTLTLTLINFFVQIGLVVYYFHISMTFGLFYAFNKPFKDEIDRCVLRRRRQQQNKPNKSVSQTKNTLQTLTTAAVKKILPEKPLNT